MLYVFIAKLLDNYFFIPIEAAIFRLREEEEEYGVGGGGVSGVSGSGEGGLGGAGASGAGEGVA